VLLSNNLLYSGGRMVYNDILEATGHTPLIRLNKIVTAGMAQVLVKFEGLNVGGSIKTRTALNMIETGIRDGSIKSDTIIAEPTSGNQGIGLALIGAVRSLRVIIIMPDSVSEERRKLIVHYGAEIQLIHDDGDIGKCIRKCLDTALDMAKKDPRVFVPQQFTNPANPRVHIEHTALEILEDAGDIKIDGFTSGVGTGGTLSGVGKVLREHNPDIVIWATEPEHAAILSGGSIGTHIQMGIGDGIIPDNLDMNIYDDICIIDDNAAISTAQDLARYEGLMCGISSGTNVAAALHMAKMLGEGKTVVTILPDTAERYFSTPLFIK
jgi:cysteine synthase A